LRAVSGTNAEELLEFGNKLEVGVQPTMVGCALLYPAGNAGRGS
jgi:hypothetical protein